LWRKDFNGYIWCAVQANFFYKVLLFLTDKNDIRLKGIFRSR
jgi:hypothetical protein